MVQTTRPTVVDLFAGCGGMSRGFAVAGFRPILAVEYDLQAAATYAANFPAATTVAASIEEVDAIDSPDVVIGGPPCQGFSGLGKRDVHDPKNSLWRHYVRLVSSARPEVFVIENVPQFLRSPEFGSLVKEFQGGALKDYKFVSGVLRAEDFGVPQKRHRAFVVAARSRKPVLPSPTHGEPDNGDRLPPWTTVRDAFLGLPGEPLGVDLPDRSSDFAGTRVDGPFTELEIHVGRTYRPESLTRYDHIGPGQGRLDLPIELQYDCWIRKPKGTTDVLGRLEWEYPALTVRTEFFKPEKGRYLHPRYESSHGLPRANRAITHAEAARLQSFDCTHSWCGTKVSIARQIGNAVPPVLAREIAIQSVRPLLSNSSAPEKNFSRWHAA